MWKYLLSSEISGLWNPDEPFLASFFGVKTIQLVTFTITQHNAQTLVWLESRRIVYSVVGISWASISEMRTHTHTNSTKMLPWGETNDVQGDGYILRSRPTQQNPLIFSTLEKRRFVRSVMIVSSASISKELGHYKTYATKWYWVETNDVQCNGYFTGSTQQKTLADMRED